MADVSFTRQFLRIPVDVTSAGLSKDHMTNETPHIWRGTDVTFQVSFWWGPPATDGTLIAMSGFTSLTMTTKILARTGGHILPEKTISPEVTPTLTPTTWYDKTRQHVSFEFDDTVTAPTAGTYWVAFSGITTTGNNVTLGTANLIIEEDGVGSATSPEPGDPTYPTTAQVAAMIAAAKWDILFLRNQTTGLSVPIQVAGEGDARTIVFGEES
jgi:hypothetical protein